MAKFEPGHEKLGGRQKGTPNRSYTSLSYWFQVVSDNSEDMEPREKIEIAFRAIGVLAPKVANLPSDPGDSLANAMRNQELLKALESSPAPTGNGNGADAHT